MNMRMCLAMLTAALPMSGGFGTTPCHAAFSAAETFTLARADDAYITYYLQQPPAGTAGPLLLVLQGSQPESVFDHGISDKGLPSRHRAGLLMIEKRGVVRGSQGCSAEYLTRNDLDARLQDIVDVLRHLRAEPWWNGELLVLGGSEGGALAVKVADTVPVKRAVLLVTGGGMTMAEAMPSILRTAMHGAPEDAIQAAIGRLPHTFADIRNRPDALDTHFGPCNTFRYWHSMLWFRPLDRMLATQTTYLLVHGDRDASHPVASARMTADAFRKAAPDRLVYWEKADLDHGLTDSAGKSHMEEILDAAVAWLFAR